MWWLIRATCSCASAPWLHPIAWLERLLIRLRSSTARRCLRPGRWQTLKTRSALMGDDMGLETIATTGQAQRAATAQPVVAAGTTAAERSAWTATVVATKPMSSPGSPLCVLSAGSDADARSRLATSYALVLRADTDT